MTQNSGSGGIVSAARVWRLPRDSCKFLRLSRCSARFKPAACSPKSQASAGASGFAASAREISRPTAGASLLT